MTVIKIKSSTAPRKRPLPEDLALGELALNVDQVEPSAYIRTATNQIYKIGNPYVGATAPNFQGVGVNGGASGFTVGELWYSPEDNSLNIYVDGTWRQIN